MEFQFFNPVTGVPDPDLGIVCLGVDALYQRIAYSFYNTVGKVSGQHDAPGSVWDAYQRSSESDRKNYVKRWVTEAVEKVRNGDIVFRRDPSESLGDYNISSIQVQKTNVVIVLDVKTRTGVATTGTLQV